MNTDCMKQQGGRISGFMAEDAEGQQAGGQEKTAEGGQDKVNGCQSRMPFSPHHKHSVCYNDNQQLLMCTQHIQAHE